MNMKSEFLPYLDVIPPRFGRGQNRGCTYRYGTAEDWSAIQSKPWLLSPKGALNESKFGKKIKINFSF